MCGLPKPFRGKGLCKTVAYGNDRCTHVVNCNTHAQQKHLRYRKPGSTSEAGMHLKGSWNGICSMIGMHFSSTWQPGHPQASVPQRFEAPKEMIRTVSPLRSAENHRITRHSCPKCRNKCEFSMSTKRCLFNWITSSRAFIVA